MYSWIAVFGLTCAALGAAEPNTLSDDEKRQGFVLLFNGRDLEGWEQKGNWKVEDGTLTRTDRGGDITYKVKAVPDHFELRFEWRVGPGSNSGVYYRPGQYEYQILDNSKHKDGQNPRTSAASLYFCMAPCRDVTNPVGGWNQGVIIGQGTVVQHWLNGVKVVDLDYKDPKYAAEVELLRIRGADLAARGAYLRLQDHGDPVWYRNLRMRERKVDEPLDRSTVVPAAIPAESLAKEKAFVEGRKKQLEEKK
jgi:hypothetical protein